jgi:predicted TIM-barrel fold metal-dependent hydrolase
VEALQELWRVAAETAQQPDRATQVFDCCRLVISCAARPVKPPPAAEARVAWQLERDFWGVDPVRSMVEAHPEGRSAADFEERYAAWLGEQIEQGANSVATSPPRGAWGDPGPTSLRSALNHLGDPQNISTPAREALYCAQARALLRCSQETRVPVCFALGVEVLEGWQTLGVADDRPFLNWLVLALKDFPRARVVLLESAWGAVQAACLAARQCPNLYVGGHWWQSLYDTSTLEQMRHRLATVPMNKVVGFFSDAYAAEWVYARLLLCEEPLAQALAERIAAGRLSEETAVEIARCWLHDNPAELLGKQG